MSRGFTMVSPAVWRSKRFLEMDTDARLLALYYIAGPHQNSSGCSNIREGYALSDLEWTADRYRKARAGLVKAGIVSADGDEVYVERWFKHCAPTNLKHSRGTMTSICSIESDTLREKAEADFAATEWGGKLLSGERSFSSPEKVTAAALAPNGNLLETRFMKGNRGVKWDDA